MSLGMLAYYKERARIMGEEEVKPITRLSGKEYSPLIIRRYSMPFLHWVAIIADEDLSTLDRLVEKYWQSNGKEVTIQDMRNAAGLLTEIISANYMSCEGVAVIFSADKLLISSLKGDFMVHEQCRLELYLLLNLSTQI